MKISPVRSTVGLNLDLSTRQHGQRKGKGSYNRAVVKAETKNVVRFERVA